ncbi:MAG: sulfotransferase, partial [Dehalococcoidia bacterium]
PRELLSMAAADVAFVLLRRRARLGSGYISTESPIIVTGMHRSGTSLVSRLLERGGAYVGGSWVDRNHEAVHFKRANMAMMGEGYHKLHDYGWAAPKSDDFIEARRGYAERAAANASRFFAERRDQAVWGWKDPRNSITLPVWLSIYPGARVLNVLRDGRAVALSLADRDELDPAFGLALWAHYTERAERGLAAVPQARKCTVRFEDITETPVESIRAIFAFAGLQPGESLEAIAATVDTERRAAREADPRLATAGDHPLLARYGYR